MVLDYHEWNFIYSLFISITICCIIGLIASRHQIKLYFKELISRRKFGEGENE